MVKKYLDETGLAQVATHVNSRLKTVTVMPSTASDGAIRMFCGEDTANYLKGHTYQYIVNTYYAWRHESHPGVYRDVYTLSATPSVGDDVYELNEGHYEKYGTVESFHDNYIGYSGYDWGRTPEGDVEENLGWVDISLTDFVKPVDDLPYTADIGDVVIKIGSGTEYPKGHIFLCSDEIHLYAWDYEFYPGQFDYVYTTTDSPQIGDHVYNRSEQGAEITNITLEDDVVVAIELNNSVTFNRNSSQDYDTAEWEDISAGGGSAEDVSYENEQIPSATNVEDALNTIIGKIYYVDPAITSFTMTPSTDTYEIGSTVNELTFAWAYNKDIVSQTLTDCILADETVRSATYDTPLSSNKTFTLTASDGKNSVSANKSVSFKHKVYWGAASEPVSFDSAFILALTGKKFATNYKGSYAMTLGEGQYGYLAYPASWGTVSSWYIGGFEITTHDCGTIEFTNASGNTTTFRITRTTQPGLGSISIEVK